MQRYGIGDQELKLAKLLWERDGIRSGEVVTICKEELNWAKSTTYTMLRRLFQHGLFKNERYCIYAVLTEEQYLGRTAEELIDDKFNGSMVTFFELYTKHYKISDKDIKTLTELLSGK
ncbi:MAG: BlaI/MecI/CopY family transcriptional regulator [Lachnospiraceae bacterium]|nr:BlaI/MecI/CopY family transcriptional regulator [Lachnospiraceae bacterium]